MGDEDTTPREGRERTDASLRVERAKTDLALGEDDDAVDETADAVIGKARARADHLIATARARIDRNTPSGSVSPEQASARRAEDRAIRAERIEADVVVRAERAEKAAYLSLEREETDRDLDSERVCSDDAVATRDAFLGIVSHDLRNLLSAMMGFATLIEESANDPHRVRSFAHRARRAGARMDRLIGDLVDVASIDAGKLAVTREVGDLEPVIAEAIDAYRERAKTSGVTIERAGSLVTIPVSFDPARILQVLINFLSNAIKFTPSGGHVVVDTALGDGEVRVTVRDTGVGIPDGALERIFDRFVQVTDNDPRGLGLGLYICKSIVHGHGGRIWAESRVGGGSSFSFTLPC